VPLLRNTHLAVTLVNTNSEAGAGELLVMARAGGEVGPGTTVVAAEAGRLEIGFGIGSSGGFETADENGWMRIAGLIIFIMTKEA